MERENEEENMSEWKLWDAQNVRDSFAIPIPSDDKYSRGVLGAITGSRHYPGAGILTCSAALETGVGLLRYLGPRYVENFVLAKNPEVIFGVGRVNSWLIGSGINPRALSWKWRRYIKSACQSGLPLCLDAGALTFVDIAKGPTIITPHFRELAALLGSRNIATSLEEISDEPKKWAALAASELGATVLLKGNISVVAGHDELIEMPAATPWLSTAGTGDVLAGIVGALMATNSKRIDGKEISLAAIAATAIYVHSNAADLALREGPITASDVAKKISQSIAKILN